MYNLMESVNCHNGIASHFFRAAPHSATLPKRKLVVAEADTSQSHHQGFYVGDISAPIAM
jgi:hypothetical protein